MTLKHLIPVHKTLHINVTIAYTLYYLIQVSQVPNLRNLNYLILVFVYIIMSSKTAMFQAKKSSHITYPTLLKGSEYFSRIVDFALSKAFRLSK